jgi:hypothetical protein
MNIEQDILDTAAKQLAAEIDRSVLKSMGYYKDVQLVRDTGTVFGIRYHTMEPRNLEWQDSRKIWDDMMLWCNHAFGELSLPWQTEPNGRWYANNAKFWFRDEKDLAWFMLRWA